MLFLALTAIALQQTPQQPVPDTARAAAPADTSREQRREPRRIPVTPELERTAFLDAPARELLLRARDSRLRQDTTLLSYDATAYQRVSMGLALRKLIPERLAFREDQVVRVQWHRDRGVFAEVAGFRMRGRTSRSPTCRGRRRSGWARVSPRWR